MQLPQTGQKSCYTYTITPGVRTSSTTVACTDSSVVGQDGNIKKGSTWPNPRFIENLIPQTTTPDGTVTDAMTGLTWMKNANCLETAGAIARGNGTLTWLNAVAWSNSLASGICGLSDGSLAGDWRLPNANEMLSLIDLENFFPALPSLHPFANVASNAHWTSTSVTSAPINAWFVSMQDGYVSVTGKSNPKNVWAVKGRGLNVIQTGQTQCFDGTAVIPCTSTSGQDGNLRSGIGMPDASRFSVSNGTVTDNLTGLVWLQNANCNPVGMFFDNAITWANGLASGACNLADSSLPGTWRIPNRNELLSLLNFDTSQAPNSDANRLNALGFIGIPISSNYYWTSDTKILSADPLAANNVSAWFVGMGNTTNLTAQNTKNSNFYAIAVRDGNFLSVNVDGTGSGMINSTTPGLNPTINCPGGTCRAYYNPPTTVTLSPTSSWYSQFMGWFGCETALGPNNECTIIIDQSKTATAVFDEFLSIRLYDTTDITRNLPKSQIQVAYDDLASVPVLNSTIITRELDEAGIQFFYRENLLFASPINVTLTGGWNGVWTTPPTPPTLKDFPGFSIVHGSLRISNGKLVAANLKIRP